jgi:hypothetical protein
LASASSPVKPNGVCGVPVLLSGWPYGSYARVSSTAFALPATLRDAFLRYLGSTLFRLTWLTKYAPPILCHS